MVSQRTRKAVESESEEEDGESDFSLVTDQVGEDQEDPHGPEKEEKDI